MKVDDGYDDFRNAVDDFKRAFWKNKDVKYAMRIVERFFDWLESKLGGTP